MIERLQPHHTCVEIRGQLLLLHMHDGERLQLHHMCGDQLIWVILAQSNEVAVRMVVGMQSSED